MYRTGELQHESPVCTVCSALDRLIGQWLIRPLGLQDATAAHLQQEFLSPSLLPSEDTVERIRTQAMTPRRTC
jgi:hypothetical protein